VSADSPIATADVVVMGAGIDFQLSRRSEERVIVTDVYA